MNHEVITSSISGNCNKILNWIKKFLEKLARPHVAKEDSLDAGNQAMAADAAREAEAQEWGDALIEDANPANAANEFRQ